jgi:uncharacterized metal-binding protein YceD (DUF177 family)
MAPEFARPVALARIPPEGREERLVATAAECAALARRFAIPAVNRLEAVLRLAVEPGGAVAVTGTLSAEVVQDCVVTLEPVTQQVSEPVALRVLAAGEEPSDDPDGPDEIAAEGGTIDLGEALAEQLALALDPYPRAPGAGLPAGPEGTAEAPSGPFAALAALRRGR